MARKINLLDCTLRDGGFALEDLAKNNQKFLEFDSQMLMQMIAHLKNANVNIIEVGSIEITSEDKRKFAIYQNVEDVSTLIPREHSADQMYVALFRGPDTPIEKIPQRTTELCEGLRVILRYSELRESLDFCAALSEKGYKVFVQPMLTMRYSAAELKMLVDAANSMNAYALYFVDSYGYMLPSDVKHFFHYFNENLKENIKIGFHAHNNINMAFANALEFISQETDRELILDSCILGMGQGAGNLQTEIIIPYLNEHCEGQYDYPHILEACEIIEGFLPQNPWGYSVARLLPAIHKVAYKYSIALRNQYGLSYVKINEILQRMPEELRHRYTPQNTIQLLHNQRIIKE